MVHKIPLHSKGYFCLQSTIYNLQSTIYNLQSTRFETLFTSAFCKGILFSVRQLNICSIYIIKDEDCKNVGDKLRRLIIEIRGHVTPRRLRRNWDRGLCYYCTHSTLNGDHDQIEQVGR